MPNRKPLPPKKQRRSRSIVAGTVCFFIAFFSPLNTVWLPFPSTASPAAAGDDSAPPQPRRTRGRREKRWVYVEEIAFILPPSPPTKRRRPTAAVDADVQTRGLAHGRVALIRQRPRSPSPLRTRGQRRKTGKEVVELRKVVIWQEPPNPTHDDFCAVCMGPGLLLCCDGNCWRAFHLACVGLDDVPTEAAWLCELCADTLDGEECGSCGVAGRLPVACVGGCARNFHTACVGLSNDPPPASLQFACSECRVHMPPVQREEPRPDPCQESLFQLGDLSE